MTLCNVVMAEQDVIDFFENEIRDFMFKILDLDLDECFVSDESMLSDFAGCGFSNEESYDDMNSFYNAWDKFVLDKIEDEYGINYSATNILLTQIAKDVSSIQNTITLH